MIDDNWIRKARKEWGGSQEELAGKLGVTKGNVSAWENGRHKPRLEQIIAISRITGYEMPPEEVRLLSAPSISMPNGEEFRVQLLANAASMGGGMDLQAEDVMTGSLTLSSQFVNEQIHPTRPDALRFIHAYGDSMSPTLNCGDILLVDTGIADVKIDGVYVLRAHERLFVKRVRQRLDGCFEISSDNPTHKTVDVLRGDHEVIVVGRVLWAWNGRKM